MRIGISAGVGKNKTIRDALQEQGLSLDYVCGGIGRCGKCAVRVISGHVPVTGADRAFFSKEALEQGWRLACQMQVTDDIEIEVAEDLVCQKEAGIQVAGLYPQDEKTDQGVPTKAAYGIAIDLGTTTIGFSLVDLATGQVESCLSRMNSQRIYGADVLSRIQSANEGHGDDLRRYAESDLTQGIKDLCKNRIQVSDIRHIVIAGNTTMCHLLRGYSCQTLGVAPFQPVSIKQEDFVQKGIAVTILPGASAFVGGDIISGIYGIREHMDADEPWMLLDFGTNGEMVLWTGEEYFATAAAAGPAFEGGNISCGCASIPGAISSVMIAGRNSHTRTISGLPGDRYLWQRDFGGGQRHEKRGDRGRKRHLCGGYPGGWICPKYAGQSEKDLFDPGRHPAVSDGKSGDRRGAEDPVKSGWYGSLAGKKGISGRRHGYLFKCARSGRDRSGGKKFFAGGKSRREYFFTGGSFLSEKDRTGADFRKG